MLPCRCAPWRTRTLLHPHLATGTSRSILGAVLGLQLAAMGDPSVPVSLPVCVQCPLGSVLGAVHFHRAMPGWGMPRSKRRSPPAAMPRVGLWSNAGGCVIRRGGDKIPNWYLSLLTADIEDLSLAEQKGKNTGFWFDQAVFPLQVPRAAAGLSRHKALPNACPDLPFLCAGFSQGGEVLA